MHGRRCRSREGGAASRQAAARVGRPSACGAFNRADLGIEVGRHFSEAEAIRKTHDATQGTPRLEQALTRGDLAIRQANSTRATAVLNALGKMIVEASATIGVEASIDIAQGERVYDPVNGVWPQKMLVSFDGPVEDADPEELRTVYLLADDPGTMFRVEWHRADGKLGRQEGGPLATVAFLTDVEMPWSDDDE